MADNQDQEQLRQNIIKYIMFDCPKAIDEKLGVLMDEVTLPSLLACAARLNQKSTIGSIMHRFNGVTRHQAIRAISQKKKALQK